MSSGSVLTIFFAFFFLAFWVGGLALFFLRAPASSSFFFLICSLRPDVSCFFFRFNSSNIFFRIGLLLRLLSFQSRWKIFQILIWVFAITGMSASSVHPRPADWGSRPGVRTIYKDLFLSN